MAPAGIAPAFDELKDRHVQGIEHELAPQVLSHRSADNPA